MSVEYVATKSGEEVLAADGRSRVAIVIRIGIDGEGAEEKPYIGWGFNHRFLDVIDHDLNKTDDPEVRGSIAKTMAESMREMAAAIESGEVLKHRVVTGSSTITDNAKNTVS